MPEHQDIHDLYRDERLRITDVRCRRFGCSERYCGVPVEDHEIVFMRAGLWVRHLGRKNEIVVDANHVFFFNRDELCETSHPLPGGDDSTVVSLASEDLVELMAAHLPSVQDRPDAPFDLTHSLFTWQSYEIHSELLRRLRAAPRGDNALAVHETVLALFDSVFATFHPPRKRRPPRAAASHRDLAEGTKLLLNERLAEAPTLPQLARTLHTSPYHLARVFRRETGLTIHRYLHQLRLRAAVERLAGGEGDLARLAADLGFSDHSHFTNAFRREIGKSPSSFRAAHAVA